MQHETEHKCAGMLVVDTVIRHISGVARGGRQGAMAPQSRGKY